MTLQHRRTPVVGDDLYGNREWNRRLLAKYGIARPLLHAHSLEFKHPSTGQQLRITAPLPADTAQIVRIIYPQVAVEHPQWVTDGNSSSSSTNSDSEAVTADNRSLSQLGDASRPLDVNDWYEID